MWWGGAGGTSVRAEAETPSYESRRCRLLRTPRLRVDRGRGFRPLASQPSSGGDHGNEGCDDDHGASHPLHEIGRPTHPSKEPNTQNPSVSRPELDHDSCTIVEGAGPVSWRPRTGANSRGARDDVLGRGWRGQI